MLPDAERIWARARASTLLGVPVDVFDPNSVSVVTAYGDLNRVTSRTDKGATTPGDQVTAYDYNNFGDLLRTTLPLGNVIEYGYDPAYRLTSVEKKPNSSTHGERTLYTLNGADNRTQIDLQHWNGSSWTTDSTIQYVFNTRCHPDKIVNADSTVTEYAYDCDGNVAKLWDANHPSSGQTNPATSVYAYDSLNRMTSITQPWGGTGGGNAATSSTYDVQDHLASVTDAEGIAVLETYVVVYFVPTFRPCGARSPEDDVQADPFNGSDNLQPARTDQWVNDLYCPAPRPRAAHGLF